MIQTGSATIFLQDGSEIPGEQLNEMMANSSIRYLFGSPFPIQFFYNAHCGSCQPAIEYLDEFSLKNPDIGIEYHDLNNSTENSTLFAEYSITFNRTQVHYPAVFLGNVGITGSDDIIAYTEPLSLWYQKNEKTDLLTGLFSWITAFLQGK